MKELKRNLLIIAFMLALCLFATACRRTVKDVKEEKVLSGTTATFTKAWDYLLLNENNSSDFWVQTAVLSDYRSDELGRRAGTVFFHTDAGEVYLFVDKDNAAATCATVYFVGKSVDGESRRSYITDIPFEGANHQSTVEVIFKGGVYYIKIMDRWITIDSNSVSLTAEGDFDFFTSASKLYGIGNSGVGTSTHKNVSGGANADERLNECLVNLTVSCDEGGTAELSETTVLKGNSVTLKVAPRDETLVPTVIYAGQLIAASAENVYTFVATESGEVKVSFSRAYLVTGNYDYADGLYPDGDMVTVQSKTAGLFGKASNGQFSLRLPDGTHTVVLTSSRYEAISFEVVVNSENVSVGPVYRFQRIVFSSGNMPDEGKYRLQNGSFELFSGVSLKNFFVSVNVERMDQGESTSGIYYYAGGTSPVKVLLLKSDKATVKVRLMRGTGWNDRSDRDYLTDIPWKESCRLSVLNYVGVLYVGVDDQWVIIRSDSAYTPGVQNTDFDPQTVWNTETEKTFGLLAFGESSTGFPVTHIAYTAGTEALKEACYASLKVTCNENSIKATLNKTKALKGTESVTLTLNGLDDRYVAVVTYAGKTIPSSGGNTYTFIPTESGMVTVTVTRVYAVTGSYGYASGLDANGDTVMVHSKTTAWYGTAANGEFRIRLANGNHTLIFTSSRFESIMVDVTVNGRDVRIAATQQFSQVKFVLGKIPADGNYMLQNGDYEQFAGASMKNFLVTANVKRMDQGESTSGVYFYAGGTSPVKVLLLKSDDSTVKVCLMRGAGWDDRSDRDYATLIPWKEEYKLSVLSYGDTLYVGIDDKWIALRSNTEYTPVVQNTDFDSATVWNANALKTFGVFAFGESATGFPVSGLSYKAASEADVNACYAALTVNCEDENVSAVLSTTRALKGTEKVTLTLTGVDNKYMPTVTYAGQKISNNGDNTYTFTAIQSGEVRITFTRVYAVAGSYSYVAGLYTDGDIIRVESDIEGWYGTASGGSFQIRLPDGTHTVALNSARFQSIQIEVTVNGGSVNISETKQFTQLKFASGYTTIDSGYTLSSSSFERFSGVMLKDFYATANVLRMDQGESTSGIYYYAGSDNPVKILLLRADNNTVKVRLMRGTGWDDRSDRDYATNVAWKEAFKLSVLSYGDTLYVGMDDQWIAIRSDTAYTSSIHNADFDPATVWNANISKSFGIFAFGESVTGFPVANLSYQAGTETLRNACYADLTVQCTGEDVNATLDKSRVLKGTETVTLTLVGMNEGYAATVIYLGNILQPSGNDTYTFVATDSGTVAVDVVRVYQVSGKFHYADGLYTDGDTVKVESETTGTLGTVSGENYQISLSDGVHTVTLTSARFETIRFTVTVSGENVAVTDSKEFTQVKFVSGHAPSDGSYILNNDSYEQFAGVSLKNFFVTAVVTRMDQGESTSGVYYYADSTSPVKILLLKNDTDNTVKVRLTRGTGWDDRSDRDYSTAIPWKEILKLSVLSYGDTLYVGIDDQWMALRSDTSYTPVVQNTDFDPATVWNENAEKTFGIFAFGNSEEGFPVSDLAYREGTEELRNSCYVDLTVHCSDANVTATLDKSKVLKGTEMVTLTLNGMDASYTATVTFAGQLLTASENNVYRFVANQSGEVSVTFTRAYQVSGSYSYADGLYADGDLVTVKSETTGAVGTAAEGTFLIRLSDGAHTIALSSSRFATIRFTVTISGDNVVVEDAKQFTQIKFVSGNVISRGNYTLQNGNYEQFAGLSVKDFFVTAIVTRMDQGESTSGVYYYTAGSSSPVKILLLRADDGMVKVRLTRGTGWDDRSDRDYTTSIPWKEILKLSVLSYGDTLYVGVDDQWLALRSDTAFTPVVQNTSFDPSTVWNANIEKTFGIFANGGSSEGFPVADIRYAPGTEEEKDNCYAELTVTCTDAGVTATLDKSKVLKGTETATLTLTNVDSHYIPIVTYNGNKLDALTDYTYTFTAQQSGEVTVSFTRVYLVSGSYGYADGLYGEGDTVTVQSGAYTSPETASSGVFQMYLPDGIHSVTLFSARFDIVTFEVTVNGADINLTDTKSFSQAKFTSGHALTNGGYTLANGAYEQFAGVALKDFYVTATVTRMDQGESTSGVYYYTAGSTSPVKILLLRADNGTVKIRLTRGTGWDDRSDRDYATTIAWQEMLTLSVLSYGDTLNVGINDQWLSIRSDTSFTPVVQNTNFDPETVWNADALKTFGVFANGSSGTGFPITGVSYDIGLGNMIAYIDKRWMLFELYILGGY